MFSALKNTFKIAGLGALIVGSGHAHGAAPSTSGVSGYVNMPSAQVEQDGTFSLGYSYDRPYGSLWAAATVFPSLQVSGRYVSIAGIPGFSNVPGEYGSEYGRFKDKVFNAKLQVLEEGRFLPAIAIGANDLQGTELFRSQYLVATKTFGAARNVEASIGVGTKRLSGPFAGVRYTPLSAPRWSLVAEYDGVDYAKDFRAAETAAGTRSSGPVLGVEYRWGWLGAQVARHRDHFSANVHISIPFNEREFVPKFQEPAAFQQKNAPARPTFAQWSQDQRYAVALSNALARQNFKNIRIRTEDGTLQLSLTNNRISDMGRAVGRATRTALAFAPEGTRVIQITYSVREQPFATYEFFDLPTLSNYLTGLSTRAAFLTTMRVRYANPADRIDTHQEGLLAGVRDETDIRIENGRDGDLVQVSSEDREANRIKIAPRIGFFFNDPSGALRYEVAATGNYDKRLGTGLYFNSAVKLNLFENITGVTQPSNSVLPHVRTDIAEYKRGGRFKLTKLLVNKFAQPDERVYTRASLGCYEEMYCGVGGQILYLPRDARWAADLSVDALRQRGYRGWLDMRDYRTVTALAALHYRLPYDTTVTARAGQFLARDDGVRLEFKRRFRSGIEIGAWFSKTNGKDITMPGTPSDPYNDKGVFLSIPLRTMLTADTQASAGMTLSPWTRDVAQMVTTPGDLYELVEHERRNLSDGDGLGNFGERADEQALNTAQPARPFAAAWPAFRMRVAQSAASSPRLSELAYAGGIAGGMVLASALLDKPVDRVLRDRADGRIGRGLDKFGKGLPYLLTGAAAGTIAFGDARAQNTGIIAMQSVAGAMGVSTLAKHLVRRARPEDELGPWERIPAGRSGSDSSFPSRHAAVAFAAVTPFAQEYDAPWLYGVAGLAASGRVAGRKHWVSDAVAGSLTGYALGHWLWNSQRHLIRHQLSVIPGHKSISVTWNESY